MKVGINNIYTSFWFLLMLLSSGTLSYIAFEQKLFSNDNELVIKIFLGFMVLLFFATSFYLLYKFRIIVIRRNVMLSINFFKLSRVSTNFSDVNSVRLENWTSQKGTVYRKLLIFNETSQISFTDMEFENFNTLVDVIPQAKKKQRSINFKQAKANLSSERINFYIFLVLLLLFLIIKTYKDVYHYVFYVLMFCLVVLLYASYKRLANYKKLLKSK